MNLELEDYEDAEQREIEGEKALARQVVIRTIEDLYLKEEREAAVAWLLDDADAEDVMSYAWVCDALGWDYAAFRSKVEAIIKRTEGENVTVKDRYAAAIPLTPLNRVAPQPAGPRANYTGRGSPWRQCYKRYVRPDRNSRDAA